MNLKFRAWDKKNDLIKDVITIYLSENAVELHFQHGENPEYKQLHEVVMMQYTGLKDKNGVEIFEGDILYHPVTRAKEGFYPYSESVASYGLREVSTGFGSTLQDAHAVWQVIGNIYENPELLEVAE